MEQENRMLFARCHDLKRKRRSYKSKKPATPDSSDEEEGPESQLGSINIYNHHEELEG